MALIGAVLPKPEGVPDKPVKTTREAKERKVQNTEQETVQSTVQDGLNTTLTEFRSRLRESKIEDEDKNVSNKYVILLSYKKFVQIVAFCARSTKKIERLEIMYGQPYSYLVRDVIKAALPWISQMDIGRISHKIYLDRPSEIPYAHTASLGGVAFVHDNLHPNINVLVIE